MLVLQGKVFALMFAWTMGMGICFDCFEGMRREFRWRRGSTAVGDVIFGAIVGCVFLVLVIWYHGGVMRGYLLLAVLSGGIVYGAWCHTWVLKGWMGMWHVVHRVASWPRQQWRRTHM